MSIETLMDIMKAENDFCSICLRTKVEVRLDPISTKMYQMFFLELVKCVEAIKKEKNIQHSGLFAMIEKYLQFQESKKTSRSICVWCRRRVMNALNLVETAQTTNRILTNISLLEKLDSQAFKEIVWDQIEANKKMHVLTARISRVTSCNVPPDTGIGSSVKSEPEEGIFIEEGDVCLNNVFVVSRQTFPSSPEMQCNKTELEHIQASKETHAPTSETSRVIPCSLQPDTATGLSVKLEQEEICDEDGNVCHDSVINEGELDRKDGITLENHDILASNVKSERDDELTSELDIEEKIPRVNEVKKRNKRKPNMVTKKKYKKLKLNKKMETEDSNVEPGDADGNQNLLYEIEIENPGYELREQALEYGSQGTPTKTNSQISAADALKHICLVQLTEAQRLQELEERRQGAHYLNSSFKCKPCAINFTYRNTYESHMERHSKDFGSYKCSMCSVYFKKKWSYQQHCKEHYERYTCTMCGFSSPRRERALDHYISQHTNQRFKCEHCTSEFRWASGLRQHMKKVHAAERSHFPCARCSQVLTSKFSYNVHMGQHKSSKEGDEPGSHGCEACSETFPTLCHLRQHQATHSNRKIFFCQSCDNKFKSWVSLCKHRRRMHPDVCFKFECDYCQKRFGLKEDLRKHINWTHLRRGYSCQFCSKVLRYRTLLKQHIKQKHKS